jgi:predicted nucleic acid-binding protein
MKFVVDTCIINKLIDGKINFDVLPQNSSFFASHIQIDEINKTPDTERKAQLLSKFTEVIPKIIPTKSAVWDVSRWDQAELSDGMLYNYLKQALDFLNKSKPNNVNDALIAETAIVNGYTLFTSDRHLAEVAQKYEGKVMYFETK